MSDSLLLFLQWLIPAGGLGSVIAWFTSKYVRQSQSLQQAQDAYKQMYDNLTATVTDIQRSYAQQLRQTTELSRINAELQQRIYKLEVSRQMDSERWASLVAHLKSAVACRHFRDCPLRPWLQSIEIREWMGETDERNAFSPQPRAADGGDPPDHPEQEAGDANPRGQPIQTP